MNTFKNIGLVVSGQSQKSFQLSSVSSLNGYTLKKVLVTGNAPAGFASTRYPQAEIVHDKHSIMQDANLDLIIVAAPVSESMDLVGELLKTGKPVRIVSQV